MVFKPLTLKFKCCIRQGQGGEVQCDWYVEKMIKVVLASIFQIRFIE